MTLTVYSKPPGDVGGHTSRLIADNHLLLDRQIRIAKALQDCPPRTTCLLCDAPLANARKFSHRQIDYKVCDRCEHVQCAAVPPENYPGIEQDFSDIYRPLDVKAYEARTASIYAPKVAWALQAAAEAKLGDLRENSWLELGSGAGYFLHALQQAGARKIGGLEAEKALVDQAAQALGAPLVKHFHGSLPDAVSQSTAQIYTAWFVLEHCFCLKEFFQAMEKKPKGTLLLFSVPTFGFATLLECAVADHYARHLDSVLHLQLFTDASIRYALDSAGYDLTAEWIFGQDSDDLYRLIVNGIRGKMPAALSAREELRLQAAMAEMQSVIDRTRLADARHILAVKN